LYIGNLKGEITQLTSDSITELYPIWSPDEKYIAYIHSGEIRIQKLLINPNGTIEKSKDSPLSITMEGETIAMFPEWGPNSDKIAFSVYQNNDFDLFIYDLVNDKLTRLTQTPNVREYHPVWSPNAEFIAFYSIKLGSQNLFSISIAKADPESPIMDSLSMEQLLEAVTLDGYEFQIAYDVRPNVLLGPSWMPSGRHIVYIRNSDDYSIEVAEFNLSGVKKLQHRKLETGTTLKSDVQCARNEAKLVFSHYAAAGGGVSFSNVKVHILPQAEFAPTTIPIEMVVFNQDNMPIEGAQIYINERAFDKKTDREGKAIGWLRKTPENPNRYETKEIALDLPDFPEQYRISLPEFSGNVTIQPLNNNKGELAKLIILAKVRMDNIAPKPVPIEFHVRDSAQATAADVVITSYDKIIGRTDLTKTIQLEIVDEAGNPIRHPCVRLANSNISITNTDQCAQGEMILTTDLTPQTDINVFISKRGYAPKNFNFYVPAAPSIRIREVLQRKKYSGWGLWGRYSTPNFIPTSSNATAIDEGFSSIILRRERDTGTLQFGFSQMKLEKKMSGDGLLSTTLKRPFIAFEWCKLWNIEISAEAGLHIVQERLTSGQKVIISPKFSYFTFFDRLEERINNDFMVGGTFKLFLPYSTMLYGSARYLKIKSNINQKQSGSEYEGGIRILLPYLPVGLEAAYTRVHFGDLNADNIQVGFGWIYY
jgi:hypothetical protein